MSGAVDAVALPPTSPMNAPMMSVLVFEVIVVWLGFAGMVQADSVDPGIGAAGAALTTVLAIAGIAGLRKRWGHIFGWLTQLAAIALGLLSPWMYVMGGMFALLWAMAFIMGRRIEKLREKN